MPLHFEGIFGDAAALLLIGIFHPIVIWCEYYFSKKIWPAFFTAGAGCLIASLLAEGLCSLFLGVLGVTCLWSIKELHEQEERVHKGWFPSNPKNGTQPKGDKEKGRFLTEASFFLFVFQTHPFKTLRKNPERTIQQKHLKSAASHWNLHSWQNPISMKMERFPQVYAKSFHCAVILHGFRSFPASV